MKWIKYLKTHGDHKVGEVVAEAEAKADVLIEMGIAEKSEKPTEILSAEQALEKQTNDFVQKTVGDVFGAMEQQFKSATDKIKNSKAPNITVGADREDSDPTFGFKNVGEQCRFIKGWYSNEQDAQVDPRMKRLAGHAAKAATTYANEGTGADGGFLLAPEFANKVLAHTFDDESLFNRTDTYTTGSNNITIPKDETTPWGTNGVQVYWTSEAGQVTQSKPKLGQDTLQLQKLSALVPVTDEMLQDSFVGLGDYISKQAGQRIGWKVDDALVNGTGVGQPLGFFNSGALVTQTKVSGQTAGTINITNIAAMISRIPNLNPANCVFMVHPAAFPQLVVLTNGNQSLYIAAGGVANANPRLGTLFGIPVIVSQHCPATIGSLGDIFLVDLSKYLTLTKGDGIQTAMSMHLFFDYNISTFRFNFRVAGQPWLSSSITSAYGTYTQSPFVTLEAR